MEEIYRIDAGFMIIAGGQTGADQAGLDWAIANGVKHGGWCPKGRKSEDGQIASIYQLSETPSTSYLQRTEWNVRDSDATLVFTLSDKLDGGSQRTIELAQRLGKPFLHIRPGVHPKYVARFLGKHTVATLNIAGKRESSAPGIGEFVIGVLSQAVQVLSSSNIES